MDVAFKVFEPGLPYPQRGESLELRSWVIVKTLGNNVQKKALTMPGVTFSLFPRPAIS